MDKDKDTGIDGENKGGGINDPVVAARQKDVNNSGENKGGGINDPAVAARQKDVNNSGENKGGGINDPVVVATRVKPSVMCKNCKQRVEPVDMMCPECGHYLNENRVIYQSIKPATARKIKLILSIVIVVVFIVLVAVGVFKLDACQSEERFTNPPVLAATEQAPTFTIK